MAIPRCFRILDAGARIELAAPDNETGMLPLHHPAMESHKSFQIVEQKATERIGKAANNAPFEMVKMLHSHVLFPPKPIPPAASTAVQVGVNLKVHIQKIVPRIAPRRALSLYTHGGQRNREFRLALAVSDSYLKVGADGIRVSHHFQLVFHGLQAVKQVFQPVSITVHGGHLSNSAAG